MKKIIAFIITLVSFASCDLTQLEPAQKDAFMKYFGADGNTRGVDLLKLDDGYLLLGNNTSRTGANTTILIKTDIAGNRLWSSSHDNFIGSSLTKSADSYFMTGDGIDGTNPTSMVTIKTNLEGAETARATLSDPTEPYHGAAVTVNSANDVVVTGVIDNSATANQIFMIGYDNNLVDKFNLVKHPATANGVARSTSKTIYEDSQGYIVWSELSNNRGSVSLKGYLGTPGNSGSAGEIPILPTKTLVDGPGDISSNFNNSGAAVQTILVNGKTAIGFYTPSNNITIELANEDVNLTAGSMSILERAQGDEYIIVGSSSTGRTDSDFYIAALEFNGDLLFEHTFGSTGSEHAVAVVPGHNGGFVMLGTLENTNDVDLMVLVKVNNNGELIN